MENRTPLAADGPAKAADGPKKAVSPKWERQYTARGLLPKDKALQGCMRYSLSQWAEVWKSVARGSASFRQVQTCKRVWKCPVCALRIMAGRAKECTAAVEKHVEAGGSVQLLTLTASHTRHQRLRDLVERQADANKRFWGSRAVGAIFKQAGRVGRITGQEVTFGIFTGWHPHRHALLFLARDLEDAEVEDLKAQWVIACRGAGLTASHARGLDVRGGSEAGAYVAKLGLEVSLANAKTGRHDRLSPFELLDWTMDARYRNAFIEYAEAMKGQRAVTWSPGLKDHFNIEHLDDAELVEARAEEDEELFGFLHWKGLHWLALYASQGKFLDAVGRYTLEELVEMLSGDPAKHGWDSSWIRCPQKATLGAGAAPAANRHDGYQS